VQRGGGKRDARLKNTKRGGKERLTHAPAKNEHGVRKKKERKEKRPRVRLEGEGGGRMRSGWGRGGVGKGSKCHAGLEASNH